jgi:hypothetical protein
VYSLAWKESRALYLLTRTICSPAVLTIIYGYRETQERRGLIMSNPVDTFCMGHELSVLWNPEEAVIGKFMEDGFIPIEMADGGKSYVDHRVLDHHNDYSDRPSACLTALEYYGEADCAESAKFMVNHVDADCVMTGITLMGLLPFDVLKDLNDEIGALDTDPLSVENDKLKYGDLIRCWRGGMRGVKDSAWSWLYGVVLFIDIIKNPASYAGIIERTRGEESDRVARAAADYETALVGKTGKVILIPSSAVWGLDVQFGREAGQDIGSPASWRHWCVMSSIQKSGAVFVSCPNKRIAETAFGPGGLKNIFPKLPEINGKFWGGRESVGGSPRGETVPDDMLDIVLDLVDRSITTADGTERRDNA